MPEDKKPTNNSKPSEQKPAPSQIPHLGVDIQTDSQDVQTTKNKKGDKK